MGHFEAVRPFQGGAPPDSLPSFMQHIELEETQHSRQLSRARPGGAMPIADGLVVDHIGVSAQHREAWRRLRMVRNLMGWTVYVGGEGVYESSRGAAKKLVKGLISLPNFQFENISVPQMKVLASIAPGCTVNAIKNSKVIAKYRLSVPDRIYNLPNISCKNCQCVSFPGNKQRDVVASFDRVPFYETSALPGCQSGESFFACKYCKKPHHFDDIWMDDRAAHLRLVLGAKSR